MLFCGLSAEGGKSIPSLKELFSSGPDKEPRNEPSDAYQEEISRGIAFHKQTGQVFSHTRVVSCCGGDEIIANIRDENAWDRFP